jgi:hypothetical protein
MLKRNYVCMFTGVGIVNPSRMARFTCSFCSINLRRTDDFVGWGRAQRGPPTHSRDRHTLARRDHRGREFRAQMVNNKPNSILQFSGTPATGFLGRLGGQASSPISCCCNEMLSLDCRLEGAPSVPKSCKKWRFSSQIRAFVHSSDLAVLGLAWCSRAIVCCEPSAFPSSLILPPSSFRPHPGDGAGGVRDGRVSWPIPVGAIDL